MTTDQYVEEYFSAAAEWLCDGYSMAISYVALADLTGAMRLLRLSVLASPLPFDEAYSFKLRTNRVAAGQVVCHDQSKDEIVKILDAAVHGELRVGADEVLFFTSSQITYETEQSDTVRWEHDLHLRINFPLTEYFQFDAPAIDRELRTGEPPFDGLLELTNWLGLDDRNPPHHFGKADLRVKPPVDFLIGQIRLEDDRLSVVLHAHPKINRESIHVAVRAVPGVAISGRRQVAGEITWTESESGLLEGRADIALVNSDATLLMLSLAGNTVRRQWIVDPVKARGTRAFATKVFDPEFRQLKRALLEDKDSDRFEKAIASLLFMLGFSPAVQVETEAPDLIVMAPSGRLLIVECTIRVADFRTKLGKLVDRRNSLSRELVNKGHFAEVHGILLCRLPMDQIVVDPQELVRHRIVLLTQVDLESGLNRLNAHNDPDAYLSEILSARSSAPEPSE